MISFWVVEVERTMSELEAVYRRMAKKYQPDGEGNFSFAKIKADGQVPNQ